MISPKRSPHLPMFQSFSHHDPHEHVMIFPSCPISFLYVPICFPYVPICFQQFSSMCPTVFQHVANSFPTCSKMFPYVPNFFPLSPWKHTATGVFCCRPPGSLSWSNPAGARWLLLYIYIYTYIYICAYMCIYIYTHYIYIHMVYRPRFQFVW